jgi:hypothetical protein
MQIGRSDESIVIPARNARTNLRKQLQRLEPEVLHVIGEESRCNGTDKLTTRQINQIIKSARVAKRT